MHRRQFLTAGAAGLALPAFNQLAYARSTNKPRRVGVVGTGWYGKCDLFR